MTDEARGLDDVATIARTDRSGMLVAVAGLPAQLRDAWVRTRSLELPGRHSQATAVAVLGVGSSAIGGDLVAATFADRLSVPLVVVRGSELPAWVGPDTLVVASSHSGKTEETLAALETAFQRRCPVAAITTGGPLGMVAEKVTLPLLAFPSGGQPRAAVGYTMLLLAGLLERVGVLALDHAEVEAAATAADLALTSWGPGVPTHTNLAKQLAWTLIDCLPVVTGSGPLAIVGRRWKTQLNENSKTMAVWDELPEAAHNTIAGYPRPGSTKDHQVHVLLAAASDDPGDALRAELAGELLEEAQIRFEHVRLQGTTRLEQVIAGVVLGDLVSAYLAVLHGVDPTPVDAIVRLEESLTDAAARASDEGADPADGAPDLD